MSRSLSISSDYAILDVKKGREALHRHYASRPRIGPCPDDLRVPVTIVGYIDDSAGNDDGTSREFSVIVTSVAIGQPGSGQTPVPDASDEE